MEAFFIEINHKGKILKSWKVLLIADFNVAFTETNMTAFCK